MLCRPQVGIESITLEIVQQITTIMLSEPKDIQKSIQSSVQYSVPNTTNIHNAKLLTKNGIQQEVSNSSNIWTIKIWRMGQERNILNHGKKSNKIVSGTCKK